MQTEPSEGFRPDVRVMLTDMWNAFMRGKAFQPVELKVGQAIYDEFVRLTTIEEIREDTPEHEAHLKRAFKSGRMTVNPKARNPYEIRIAFAEPAL